MVSGWRHAGGKWAQAEIGPWLVVTGLIALNGLVFWPVLTAEFLTYDDPLYVVDNPHIGRWSGDSLLWPWTTFEMGHWHPLTWYSLMLDGWLFGKQAAAFHRTNLLLHTANTLLLWWGLRRLTGSVWRSAWVAALFAVHPLHVEPVAWISSRKDVLSGLFVLASLGTYAWYGQSGARVAYGLTGLGYGLGLLAKGSVVLWPLVLLGLDVWPLRRWQACGWRSCLRDKLPFLVLAGMFSGVALWAAQASGAMQDLQRYPLEVRLANAVVAYATYLLKTVFPVGLAPFYPHPGVSLSWGAVTASAVVLLSLSVGVWLLRDRSPAAGMGWWWFVVLLLPVMGLFQAGVQASADRYTYLPLVGLFVGVCWTWPAAESLRGLRLLGSAVGGAAVLVCAVLSWQQAGRWRDSVTLFTHAAQVTPPHVQVELNLAVAWKRAGRTDAARRHFEQAVRLDPQSNVALFHWGQELLEAGDTAQAVEVLTRARELNPRVVDVRLALGRAYAARGDTELALAEFRAAVELAPKHPLTQGELGAALHAAGRRDEALPHLRLAAELARPPSPLAWTNLGMVLAELGRTDEALASFSRAVQLDPQFLAARLHRARLLHLQGAYEQAVDDWAAAVQLDPQQGVARQNLAADLVNVGIRQANRGELAAATATFRQAVQVSPTSFEAHYYLGRALAWQNQGADAVGAYRTALELRPAAAEVRVELAKLLIQWQRPLEAMAELEQALATHPDLTEARQMLSELRAAASP